MSSRTVLERSDVRWKKASPEGFESVHRPFETVSRVLSRGWTEQDGVRPMAVDTIWDKDQPIKLRDGTVIYCDVFRPASSEDTPVPALIAWGPFGKSSNGEMLSCVLLSARQLAELTSRRTCRISVPKPHEISSWHSKGLDKRSRELGSA